MTSSDTAAGAAGPPATPADDSRDRLDSAGQARPAEGARVAAPVGDLPLPEQSREDTDAAWGEYARRDDERLYQDRPPHWRDF